jgi:hypothetical protein
MNAKREAHSMTTARTETAISAALAKAGANTTEYRLRMLATDALHKHHSHIERAAKTLERSVDGDAALIFEALRIVVQRYALPANGQTFRDTQPIPAGGRQPDGDDRDLGSSETQPNVVTSSPGDGAGLSYIETHAASARPVVEPSPQQRAAETRVRATIALNVFDRELTRTGQLWGNVQYCDLENFAEDGELARAVKNHIGQIRGKDRLKPVRELMTPREFHACLRKVGRTADGGE